MIPVSTCSCDAQVWRRYTGRLLSLLETREAQLDALQREVEHLEAHIVRNRPSPFLREKR